MVLVLVQTNTRVQILVAVPWVKLSVLRETSSPSVCLFFYDFSERQDCHIGSVSSPPSQFRSAHGFLKKRLHGIPDSALPSLQVIHLIYHGAAILGTIEKNQSLSFLSFLCLLYGPLSTSGIPVLGDYGRHCWHASASPEVKSNRYILLTRSSQHEMNRLRIPSPLQEDDPQITPGINQP